MQSFILKKQYHELGWDVLNDFKNERSLINQEHYKKVLMSFQKSISRTSTGKSMITQERMVGAAMVKHLVIGLLGELNIEIFRNEKSATFSKTKKAWLMKSEMDFGFDDSPQLKQAIGDKSSTEDSSIKVQRHNLVIYLTDQEFDNSFVKKGTISIIGRMMDQDCDFMQEVEILYHYFAALKEFEVRGDECYGFLTDLTTWTFFKRNYKTNQLFRSETLEINIDDIREGEDISQSSAEVISVLPSILIRLLSAAE